MIIKRSNKLVTLIISIFLFLVLVIFNVYFNREYKAIYKNMDRDIIEKLKETTTKQLDIKVDNNTTYYSQVENTYYYYIDEKNDGKSLPLDLEILSKEKYNYTIDNKTYSKNQKIRIDYLEPIKIILYNKKNYFEVNLKFISVPILNIKIDQIDFFEKEALFEFYGIVGEELKYITGDTLIKLRGSTSINYPKKQFKLSLVNNKIKNQTKNEIALLGMEKDEDWILDGMYPDYSKIRSKLAFELWNEINSYTVDQIDNDIELEYVDIYFNNEYFGLYLLKEFVDKKLLKLDSTTFGNSGVLIKGKTYDTLDLTEYDKNKKGNTILPFEIKYPNNVYDYSNYWDSIIPRIYDYYFNKQAITDEYILSTFDIYNFVDYNVFTNVIAGIDNFGQKNMYLSVYNMDPETKIIITPWDLDITFGYYMDDDAMLQSDYSTYNQLYTLLNNSDYINELVIERYFELRENVLSVKHINSLIDSYYNQIKYSVMRDREKWLETDLKKEINDIKKWYKKRVEFLDEYLGEYDV